MLEHFKAEQDYAKDRVQKLSHYEAEALKKTKAKKTTVKVFQKKNVNTLIHPVKPKAKIKPQRPARKGAKKRKYGYIDYEPRQPKSKKRHHDSHLVGDFKSILPAAQDPVGPCILCSGVYAAVDEQELLRHYRSVHYSHHLIYNKVRVMLCKCNDIEHRGEDGSFRNAHFHCTFCYHPSEQRKYLAKHKMVKHGQTFQQVQHLLPSSSKGKKPKSKAKAKNK